MFELSGSTALDRALGHFELQTMLFDHINMKRTVLAARSMRLITTRPLYTPSASVFRFTTLIARTIHSATTKPVQHSDGHLQPSNHANFLSTFIANHRPPERSIDHFASIPWTDKILKSPSHEIIPFYSRYLDTSSGESRFFAQTVNTSTTIPHVLALRNRSLKASSLETSSADFLTLLHLGKDLESHPGIVNGGFQSVIFDEVMYCTLLLHAHVGSDEPRPKHYTVSLGTKFLAPVRAGTDVLVRCNLEKREGRKWFLKAEMVDKDGKVCIAAESIWVTARVGLPAQSDQ